MSFTFESSFLHFVCKQIETLLDGVAMSFNEEKEIMHKKNNQNETNFFEALMITLSLASSFSCKNDCLQEKARVFCARRKNTELLNYSMLKSSQNKSILLPCGSCRSPCAAIVNYLKKRTVFLFK